MLASSSDPTERLRVLYRSLPDDDRSLRG